MGRGWSAVGAVLGSGELFSERWVLLLLCGLAEELVGGGGLGARFRILFDWREASVDSGGQGRKALTLPT